MVFGEFGGLVDGVFQRERLHTTFGRAPVVEDGVGIFTDTDDGLDVRRYNVVQGAVVVVVATPAGDPYDRTIVAGKSIPGGVDIGGFGIVHPTDVAHHLDGLKTVFDTRKRTE